jgi:hypothetical protein
VTDEPKDLTKEARREYDYGGGHVYMIVGPQKLWVGKTTHRVLDSEGVVHCVPFPTCDGKAVFLRWYPRNAAEPVQF